MNPARETTTPARRGSWPHMLAAILFLVLPRVDAAAARPSPDERAALEKLRSRVTGRIVWESNRTGQWELYVMHADGSNARQLTRLARLAGKRPYDGYLRPRISPDGKTVLFAYGKADAPCEVWTASMANGKAKKLTIGAALNWAPDGSRVYFVRDSKLWSHDIATDRDSLVYPTRLPVDGRSGGMVGMVAPDLKSGVFRTPRRNEFVTLPDGKFVRTMGGCEPRFSSDGRYVYWVNGPKDFRRWDIKGNREYKLLGTPPVSPFNYTYCPTVSADGRWLLYGASPGQHSHTTSDYEVYVQELRNWKPIGKPARLTFNRRTDRWPTLWVDPKGAPHADAESTIALRGHELPVFMFADENAGPEFGGDWGLWPQVDGCRGTATFLAGQDAEGGNGGAMRIDYDISGAPRSFSLWTTPAPDTVDISSCDRFVVFAKGSVPSFTLVVKDRNAADPDAPNGIADYHVTGLTSEWRRFDVLFKDFVPRKRGAAVDWHAINHVGIALIAPLDKPKGTLFVDNLRAAAGAQPADVPGHILQLVFAGKSAPVVDNSAPNGPAVSVRTAPSRFLECRSSGIAMTGPALLASAKPAKAVTDACVRSGEVSVTAWVKPERRDQTGPARIFTISADSGQRNLTLGQDGHTYIVRLRTTERSTNGLPSLDGPSGIVTTNWTHVAYTRDRRGNAALYVNGKRVAQASVPGDLSNWDASFRIGIANELTGDRPWLGEIRSVSLFDRGLAPGDVLRDMRSTRPDSLAKADRAPPYADGWIIWESNRTGSWRLYRADLNGKHQKQLTDGPGDFTRAKISGDGTRVLYTRTLRGKPPEVWIMRPDGSESRRLIANASDPQWRCDDSVVHFLRQPDRAKKQWQIWAFELGSGKERRIFPVDGVKYKPDIWSAQGNDSGKRFVAWSPKPRGTWVLSADGKIQTHVHGGCEGQVAPDQHYGFGVQTAGIFVRFSLADGSGMTPILKRKGPWSHTYFPCVSRDQHWLVFGACPPNQHNHDTSDYEIFLVRLTHWKAAGEPIRLTFDKRTDRWPAIYVPTARRSTTGATARRAPPLHKQG